MLNDVFYSEHYLLAFSQMFEPRAAYAMYIYFSKKMEKGEVFTLSVKDYFKAQESTRFIKVKRNWGILQKNLELAKYELLNLRNGIEVSCILDKDFLLNKETYYDEDLPLILFFVGNRSVINKSSIGFVGSRDIQNYSLTVIDAVLKKVKDYVIVSGLAVGVDSKSHQAAIKNNLETIAILPSSLNSIYPKINEGLAKDITRSNGLLISEYPSYHKISKKSFSKRNRLIVLFSNMLFIVQANEEGGTMRTSKIALAKRRKLLVLSPASSISIEQRAYFMGNKNLLRRDEVVSIGSSDDFIENIVKINQSLFLQQRLF